MTGSLTETRVADAPAGAHALSGSWKMDKYDNVSDEGTTVTYKLNGDTLHMTSPAGQSYDAKLDGTEVPIQGDTGGPPPRSRRPATTSTRRPTSATARSSRSPT